MLLLGCGWFATLNIAQSAGAAPSPVAIVAGSPSVKPLATCIAERARASGPVLNQERMVEGLEFRLVVHAERDRPALLIVNGWIKPDVAGLIASHNHDDHPESQLAAATRFYHLLRVPLGNRAWQWQRAREQTICDEVAAWIEQVRRHPINFDRIGADGEPG